MVNTADRERSHIRPVKRAVEDRLLDLPGVVAVDIGTKRTGHRFTGRQAIVVSVERKRAGADLPPGGEVPADVLGVPTDVIEERVRVHVDRRPAESEIDSAPEGPGAFTVSAGGGIMPCRRVVATGEFPTERIRRVGTLGVLVRGTGRPRNTMGLTTFDVACMDDAWAVGDRMAEPHGGRSCAGLARSALSGRVDAAAVMLDDTLEHDFSVPGTGPVVGPGAARYASTVRKHGYGTGLTSGIVASIDTTLRVDHGECLGVRTLRDQLRVVADSHRERFAGPGDAGAVLIDADARVVGLHLAGNHDGTVGFACPIGNVLTALDIELCATPTHATGAK